MIINFKELDALIAEKVFNLNVVRFGYIYSIGEPKFTDDQYDCDIMKNSVSNPIPFYSTDINKAFEIVEFIDWNDFRLSNIGTPNKWVVMSGIEILGVGPTIPLAICFSALKAYGINYEKLVLEE